MNNKYSEGFHASLTAQYRELILEAYVESEEDHKTSLNIGALNIKLKQILAAAELDGLTHQEISDLIDEAGEFRAPLKKTA